MKKNQFAIVSKFKLKNIPAFENVSIKNDLIYMSNGLSYCGIKTDLDIEASFSSDEFKKILTRGEITSITTEGKKANIHIGSKLFSIQSDADLIPDLPTLDIAEESVFNIDTSVLNIKTFVGTDELRPAMTGVFYDHVANKLIATDAHRMQWIDTNLKLSWSIIISKDIFHLPKDTYKAVLLKDHLYLESETLFAYISLIDEKYPDYNQVIPKESILDISFSKADLKDVLDDATICANPTTNKVVMYHTPDALKFQSEDLDFNREYKGSIKHFESNMTSDSFEIGFSIKFMNEILKTIDSDKITFSLTNSNRAIIINGNTLCMPVMI